MSGKLLRQFDIPSIDSDQARELADSVAPIFALIENNLRESKSLEQTRDALLPKLMSGEIDVSRVNVRQLNNHLAYKTISRGGVAVLKALITKSPQLQCASPVFLILFTKGERGIACG